MVLNASQIFDLAAEGDRAAGEVMRYTSGTLADAIADISLLLNPEVVVLGGGVGSHPELCRVIGKLLPKSESGPTRPDPAIEARKLRDNRAARHFPGEYQERAE